MIGQASIFVLIILSTVSLGYPVENELIKRPIETNVPEYISTMRFGKRQDVPAEYLQPMRFGKRDGNYFEAPLPWARMAKRPIRLSDQQSAVVPEYLSSMRFGKRLVMARVGKRLPTARVG